MLGIIFMFVIILMGIMVIAGPTLWLDYKERKTRGKP